MVTIGKYNGDINCWGLSHNDFHRGLMQVPENIDVQLNSTNNNNPLVLKANSMFFIWGSSGITISANSSGNASYPAGSTYDYFRPSAIFTSTDFAPLWTSTSISSTGGNGTYYMVCKGGVDTTSVGSGTIDYLMSTVFTPVFNRMMCGWYGTTAGSTEWRALGRFIMTAGIMSRACVFIDHELPPGYISNINVFSTGTNVYLSPFTADLGGNKAVQYLQEVNLTAIAGLTASTWYAVSISEIDYTIANSSMAGGITNLTITGNKLNLFSVYDYSYNFMRGTIATTSHRIIDTYAASSGSSSIILNQAHYTKPKTYIYAVSTASTAFTGTIGFPVTDIVCDTLSEATTGTTFYINPVNSKSIIYDLTFTTPPSSVALGNNFSCRFRNGSTAVAPNADNSLYYVQGLSSSLIYRQASCRGIICIQKNAFVYPYISHDSSVAQVIYGSTIYSFFTIQEV